MTVSAPFLSASAKAREAQFSQAENGMPVRRIVTRREADTLVKQSTLAAH